MDFICSSISGALFGRSRGHHLLVHRLHLLHLFIDAREFSGLCGRSTCCRRMMRLVVSGFSRRLGSKRGSGLQSKSHRCDKCKPFWKSHSCFHEHSVG
jgi:hypothetical protein